MEAHLAYNRDTKKRWRADVEAMEEEEAVKAVAAKKRNAAQSAIDEYEKEEWDKLRRGSGS